MAVSFRMRDTGQPAEEAPLVPVGHTCGESTQRIILTMHGLPADRVWYLVLVQAYLEQDRAKGDRAWCDGVVVTNRWKARTDNKWAVYWDVKELSVDEGVRTYDMGRHTVYCHYPRKVVHIPEPTYGRVVVFLDGSREEGQPPKAEAVVQSKGVGPTTEIIVDKVVYRTASHGEVGTVADVVRNLGQDVTEVYMVMDAGADMASLRQGCALTHRFRGNMKMKPQLCSCSLRLCVCCVHVRWCVIFSEIMKFSSQLSGVFYCWTNMEKKGNRRGTCIWILVKISMKCCIKKLYL